MNSKLNNSKFAFLEVVYLYVPSYLDSTILRPDFFITFIPMIKALIVDDEKKAREIMEDLIETYLPEITSWKSVGSAEEAEEVLPNFQPDLLFLDIEMPGKNGFDLLNALEQHNFKCYFHYRL